MVKTIVFTLVILLSFVNVANAGSGTQTRHTYKVGQFSVDQVNGYDIPRQIVSIDNVLSIKPIQWEQTVLDGVLCQSTYYSITMMWGEHVNARYTDCNGYLSLNLVDNHGQTWDF